MTCKSLFLVVSKQKYNPNFKISFLRDTHPSFCKIVYIKNLQTRTRKITSMRPFSDLSLLSSFHVPFCDHDPHLAPFSAEKNAFFCDFLAVNSDVSDALKRTSFQLFRQRGRKTIFWHFPNKHTNIEVMVPKLFWPAVR